MPAAMLAAMLAVGEDAEFCDEAVRANEDWRLRPKWT